MIDAGFDIPEVGGDSNTGTDLKTHSLSLATARRLALQQQLFRHSSKFPRGIEGAARTIEHLGYVQIDTISVIQRAHHHTLWTRRPDYSPDMLHRLQTVERKVFEYWGHALSLLPIEDYRYYLPRMERFRDPENTWLRQMRSLCGNYMKPALERIRAEGPLSAKDFKSKRMDGVWRAKPTTGALDLLFFTGELMITERRGMERVYDLTERVLPDTIDTSRPTDDELGAFVLRRALRAHGIVTEPDVRQHIDAAEQKTVRAAIRTALDEGSIVPVRIEENDSQTYYTEPSTLQSGKRLRARKPHLHLLSPFDNLIILRDRLNNLFGLDYRLECYTPPAKRKYGYFVLPILWGEEIVGRLDPKTDRKKRVLLIRNLWIENKSIDLDTFLPQLADKLKALAKFVAADRVKIERSSPTGIRTRLQKLL